MPLLQTAAATLAIQVLFDLEITTEGSLCWIHGYTTVDGTRRRATRGSTKVSFCSESKFLEQILKGRKYMDQESATPTGDGGTGEAAAKALEKIRKDHRAGDMVALLENRLDKLASDEFCGPSELGFIDARVEENQAIKRAKEYKQDEVAAKVGHRDLFSYLWKRT